METQGQSPLVPGTTASQVPAPEVQSTQDSAAAYRKMQAERDRLAALADQAAQEKAKLEQQLKRKMDSEERREFEMAQNLATTKEKLQKLESELKQKEAEQLKQRILTDNPDLKPFEEDLDLTGLSEEQAREYVQVMKQKLEGYYEHKSKLVQTENPPKVESAKSTASTSGEISAEQFSQLPKEEREKYLRSVGLLS